MARTSLNGGDRAERDIETQQFAYGGGGGAPGFEEASGEDVHKDQPAVHAGALTQFVVALGPDTTGGWLWCMGSSLVGQRRVVPGGLSRSARSARVGRPSQSPRVVTANAPVAVARCSRSSTGRSSRRAER